MLQGKVWGSTETLFKNAFIEIHHILIKPNSYCSMHCHQWKSNAFYVKTGVLFIDVRKNDYKLTDTTILGAGDFTVVKPLEYHCFRTTDTPVDAIEIYFPQELGEDIIRETVGGAN